MANVHEHTSSESELAMIKRVAMNSETSTDSGGTTAKTKWWIASGIFLLVLGIYALSGPGRIDIIDGQARFDVAYNWLLNGRPIFTDSWITPIMGVRGRNGFFYSSYGAPASVFAMPLVGMRLYDQESSQFLFSLTSTIFGAGIAPLLFLFYLELGVTRPTAFLWTMVSSFATFVWPASTSTFDNAQHAFFVVAAVYFGFLSARRRSATYAALGGAMAGVLVLYQEYFLLIVPALALSTLEWKSAGNSSALPPKNGQVSIVGRVVSAAKQMLQAVLALLRAAWDGPGEARSSCLRYGLFLAVVSIGVVMSLAYNDLRFGSWLRDGKNVSSAAHRGLLLGNPLSGLLTLLISPGKGIFLYSPPIVLGILGIGQLWRRRPELIAVIGAASLILVLFISCIAFAGGDWCWGPRYLVVLLPLWALAFPFTVGYRVKRNLAFAIVGVGFLVQGLALSVENQRFFFERGLNDFFWAEDSWFYFKHSALFARVDEAVSLREGVPPTARLFNSIPAPELTTYSLLGPPRKVPRKLAPIWIRNYQIYFLPRPWPLWMSWLRPDQRPIDVGAWLVGLLSTTVLGASLAYRGFKLGSELCSINASQDHGTTGRRSRLPCYDEPR